MTSYLQSWVDSSKGLPAELVRCFKLMQELDGRSLSLQNTINTCSDQRMQAAKAKGAVTGKEGLKSVSELEERIVTDMGEVMRIADEKVNLAQQIYDFVDRNICRLDKDLKNFDAELSNENSRLGVDQGVALPDAKRRKKNPDVRPGQETARPQAAAAVPMTEVDPNEPTYCYCNRVSFGEMIGCDNPDCAIEWFHFECVGIPLDGRPKGKWYCKDCTALKKLGKIS